MGVEKVPERTETTCDKCKNIKESRSKSWFRSGMIHVCCNSIDSQGSPIGPGDNWKYTFCDNCYQHIVRAIDEAFKPELEAQP